MKTSYFHTYKTLCDKKYSADETSGSGSAGANFVKSKNNSPMPPEPLKCYCVKKLERSVLSVLSDPC